MKTVDVRVKDELEGKATLEAGGSVKRLLRVIEARIDKGQIYLAVILTWEGGKKVGRSKEQSRC